MAFEQFIIDTPAGTARVRWADYNTSGEWFCRLGEVTSPTRLRELDRSGWRDQERALRDALTAASNAYRALTLPPVADPAFAIEWAGAFTSTAAVQRANAILTRMGENGLAPLAAAYVAPPLSNPGAGNTLIQPWAWLDSQALPVYWPTAVEGDSGNPRRDFDGIGTGCGRAGSLDQGCDPFTWDTISWAGPVVVARGYQVLAPARWTMEALQRVAMSAIERGARGVLLDAQASVALQNAVMLNRYRVANMGELASQVLTSRAAWEPDATIQGVQTGLAVAAAAINAVPVYGQIASAVLGIVAGILGLANEDPNAGYAMPFLLNGYIQGTEPVDGRLVSAPTYAVAPPAGGTTSCVSVPTGQPRVIATMRPGGTLALSLMDNPEGTWRRATFEVIGADRTSRSTPASYPAGDASVPGLSDVQSYFVRAVITRSGGDTFLTPIIATVPVAAPLDGADLLRRLAIDCRAWLAMNRNQQLEQLRSMGELADADARMRAQTAITAHCVNEVGRSGMDIPAPPGPRTIGPLPFMPPTAPEPGAPPPPPPSNPYVPGEPPETTLARTGLDAAGWRRLSVSDREAALERAGVPVTDRPTARAAIDAHVDAGEGSGGMSRGAKIALAIAGAGGVLLAARALR